MDDLQGRDIEHVIALDEHEQQVVGVPEVRLKRRGHRLLVIELREQVRRGEVRAQRTDSYACQRRDNEHRCEHALRALCHESSEKIQR